MIMDFIELTRTVGVPIASGITMAYFIFLIMKRLMGDLVKGIKDVEQITLMLITRANNMNNDMIRVDTLVSSALGVSPDLDRLSRAMNFAEDGTIDARRD